MRREECFRGHAGKPSGGDGRRDISGQLSVGRHRQRHPLARLTLSPASASVQAGAPLQFTATVVSSDQHDDYLAVNNILGGNSTLGTVNSSGLYMAPASVPNPATVTVKAISSAETYPYGAAIVTITAPAVNRHGDRCAPRLIDYGGNDACSLRPPSPEPPIPPSPGL